MEIFAAYAAYSDHEIGRILDTIEEMGKLDNTDFSQFNNIADPHPDKVKEMKKLFIAEAKKYQVFPMDASVAARLVAPRPNITAGRTEFVYTRPMVGLPQGDSPALLNSSYTITADIEKLETAQRNNKASE